jgi:hypothetical protein
MMLDAKGLEAAAKAAFAKANEGNLKPETIENLWPSQHLPHWSGLAEAAITAYFQVVGPQPSNLTTVDAVRKYLATSPHTTLADVRDGTGIESKLVSNALGYLVRQGEVRKAGYGSYEAQNLRSFAIVTPTADEHLCSVCAEPFKADDPCASDIELGICHAACLEGCPTVDLETGEPVEGPIPTYRYGDAK